MALAERERPSAGMTDVEEAAEGGAPDRETGPGEGGARSTEHLTSAARIRARVSTGAAIEPWRRKVKTMRALVAGDWSAIDGGGAAKAPLAERERSVDKRGAAHLAKLMVSDFEEGASNPLLETLKTLVMQVSYRSPEIEFEDATPMEADMNALYLKRRFGPRPGGCDAPHHMKLALIDYLVAAMGWVWAGSDGGRPDVRYVDALDVSWDLDAALVTDIRWVAVHVVGTAGDWADLFGEEAFAAEIEDARDEKDPGIWRETLVQLVWYWDTDGELGTHAVFRAGSGNGGYELAGEPLEWTENPHYLRTDDVEQPFLPLLPIYFLQLPGVRFPVSPVEMMIAAQLGLREVEGTIRSISKIAPWIDVEEGAYEEDQLTELEDGEPGAIIERTKGMPPAQHLMGPDIPANLLQWRDILKQGLTAMGGSNPYASGNKIDGIAFASEVSAIEGAAGLTAATVASDHAGHYQRAARATLANGANYDGLPLVLVLDDTPMTFGTEDPIGPYLRPDAHAQVSEDALVYASKDQRIGRAAALYDQALKGAPFLGPVPVQKAFKGVLEASGERDVASWFASPAAPDGGAAGEADPVLGTSAPGAPGGGAAPAGEGGSPLSTSAQIRTEQESNA